MGLKKLFFFGGLYGVEGGGLWQSGGVKGGTWKDIGDWRGVYRFFKFFLWIAERVRKRNG